jgi:hypothetical protein
MWIYACTPPYVFMTKYLVKHRDTITLHYTRMRSKLAANQLTACIINTDEISCNFVLRHSTFNILNSRKIYESCESVQKYRWKLNLPGRNWSHLAYVTTLRWRYSLRKQRAIEKEAVQHNSACKQSNWLRSPKAQRIAIQTAIIVHANDFFYGEGHVIHEMTYVINDALIHILNC